MSIQHVDANTMRITEFGYDWQGRQVYTFGEEDVWGNITYTKQTYDHLGRTVKSERFLLTENAGNTQPSGSERVSVLNNDLNDDRLLARTETFYDQRGRVYKTEQCVVNPTNGNIQGRLLSQSWYDAAGRVIKTIEPGANHVSEMVYDSLGRVKQSLVKVDDTVLTQSETEYDNHGKERWLFSILTKKHVHIHKNHKKATKIGT